MTGVEKLRDDSIVVNEPWYTTFPPTVTANGIPETSRSFRSRLASSSRTFGARVRVCVAQSYERIWSAAMRTLPSSARTSTAGLGPAATDGEGQSAKQHATPSARGSFKPVTVTPYGSRNAQLHQKRRGFPGRSFTPTAERLRSLAGPAARNVMSRKNRHAGPVQ